MSSICQNNGKLRLLTNKQPVERRSFIHKNGYYSVNEISRMIVRLFFAAIIWIKNITKQKVEQIRDKSPDIHKVYLSRRRSMRKFVVNANCVLPHLCGYFSGVNFSSKNNNDDQPHNILLVGQTHCGDLDSTFNKTNKRHTAWLGRGPRMLGHLIMHSKRSQRWFDLICLDERNPFVHTAYWIYSHHGRSQPY